MSELENMPSGLNDAADPVAVPSVLDQPRLTEVDIDFKTMLEQSAGLTGKVDKKPKTAAI